MGIKSLPTTTLVLQDAEVPVHKLLGAQGRGHIIPFNILNVGRYKLEIGRAGGAKRSRQLSAEYATERKQFDTAISDLKLTREKLGTMAAGIYANEGAVYRTVGLFEQRMGALTQEEFKDGREVAAAIAEYQRECSMNKYSATELLDYVVDEAVQLHG